MSYITIYVAALVDNIGYDHSEKDFPIELERSNNIQEAVSIGMASSSSPPPSFFPTNPRFTPSPFEGRYGETKNGCELNRNRLMRRGQDYSSHIYISLHFQAFTIKNV